MTAKRARGRERERVTGGGGIQAFPLLWIEEMQNESCFSVLFSKEISTIRTFQLTSKSRMLSFRKFCKHGQVLFTKKSYYHRVSD